MVRNGSNPIPIFLSVAQQTLGLFEPECEIELCRDCNTYPIRTSSLVPSVRRYLYRSLLEVVCVEGKENGRGVVGTITNYRISVRRSRPGFLLRN